LRQLPRSVLQARSLLNQQLPALSV